MGNLQTRHLQEIVDISHRALACENMDELQEQTLAAIEHSVGATSSLYTHVSGARHQLLFREGRYRGVHEGAVARWCDSYHRLDPFMHRYLNCLSTSPRNVVISSEVVPHREYVASRFYNEFLKTQSIYHVMIIGLKPLDGAPFGLIGLHRTTRERGFSATDVAKANMLAPGIKGAVERILARQRLAQRDKDERVNALAEEPRDTQLQQQQMARYGLSRREREVASLLHKGLTSQAIATQLHISVRTVDNHVRSMFDKTGVHNRTTLLYRLSQ